MRQLGNSLQSRLAMIPKTALVSAVLLGVVLICLTFLKDGLYNHIVSFDPNIDASYITEFRLLGPFPWDSKLVAGQKGLTAVLGKPMFPAEAEMVANGTGSLPPGRRWQEVHADNGLFRLHTIFPQTIYQGALAETRASSLAEEDAVLETEADDGVQVWLNGVQVFSSGVTDSIQQFKNYTRIHLKKGINRIVLKLVRTQQSAQRDSWDFAIGLRSLDGSKEGKGRTHAVAGVVNARCRRKCVFGAGPEPI
jgi:hypothetical protein